MVAAYICCSSSTAARTPGAWTTRSRRAARRSRSAPRHAPRDGPAHRTTDLSAREGGHAAWVILLRALATTIRRTWSPSSAPPRRDAERLVNELRTGPQIGW